MILCLVGKSGSGKTTLAEVLEQNGFKQVQSYTTRPKRHENEQGHIFVSQEEFNAIRGDLVAYTKFADYEYGAIRQQIESCDIYVIDPAGVEELAKNIGRENMYVVYIETSGIELQKRLILSRGKKEGMERWFHDIEKFAGFDDYNMVLRNETYTDLATNIAILTRTMGVLV
jgi:guanylate kinase